MKTNPAYFAGMVPKSRPVVDKNQPTGVTTRPAKRKHFYGSFKILPKTKEQARLEEIIGR